MKIRVIILGLIFAAFDSPKLSGVFAVYDANAFDISLDCFSEVHLEMFFFFWPVFCISFFFLVTFVSTDIELSLNR